MKLDTGTRKRFRVSNKVKELLQKIDLDLVFLDLLKIFQLKLLMIQKKLLYYQLRRLKKI